MKNVLVAGGASGIGRATAEEYLKNGDNVVIFDINEKEIQEFLKINNRFKDKLLTIIGDVRDRSHINKTIESVKKKYGNIHVFIYSVGIFPDHEFINMKEIEWDNVIDINLKGAFLFCQKIAQQMIIENVKGHIITISSGSYKSARVGSSHYCASKAGLVMLTKVMAMELSQYGIKVNSIAPGLIEHPRLNPRYKTQFAKRIPAGRVGKPSEVTSIIFMLTEVDNDYLTGQVISIDGGLSTGQYGLISSNEKSLT